LAENPSITVSVLADIKALEAGMSTADQVVKRTTASMSQSVDKIDLGNRMGKQAALFTRAASAMSDGIRKLGDDTMTAVQKVDGLVSSLSMMGGKVGMAAGATYDLGRAIYDLIAGTEELNKADAERVQGLQRRQSFQDETADLERQLKILKETDLVKKAELELERELERIRTQQRNTLTGGAEAEAERLFKAREALEIEKARQKMEDLKNKTKTAQDAPGSMIDTLTTSIGNTFRLATRGAAAAMQQQQTQAQQTISANVAAILSMMRSQSGIIA
jgi:hypothetical protein